MDKTLIAIGFFLLLAIVFILLFLFKSISKSGFKASDGNIFASQADLDIYQNLLERTKPLFSSDPAKASSDLILGFDTSFLNKLKNGGFIDLKTLIKYRNQFQLLSDLINK